MAETPRDAVIVQLDVISDSRNHRFRDTIQPPFTQGSATSETPLFTIARVEDVPEYVCDSEWFVSRGYKGTTAKLDAHYVESETDAESTCTLAATRYHADGAIMQSFTARFTFVKVGDGWRCVRRQLPGITKP